MQVARPVQVLPPARWVDDWTNNPNNRKSLRFISQTTKDQVAELAGIIPDITVPWNKVPLLSKTLDGENEVGLDGPMVGAVVGAVQSGKTASMVGLISHLFDKGYDAVVVLTGTKNDLNLQTAIRLKNDVFDFGQEVLAEKSPHAPEFCTSPFGEGPHRGIDQHLDFFSSPVELGYGKEWNNWLPDMRRALRGRKPSLCVSKKSAQKAIPAMLRDLELLNRYCNDRYGRELRWAIIDDESDQVSVARNPDAPTPRQLWTVANIGECVYISYSATPQANLFAPIPDGNPLFPKHFCFMLRASHYDNNPVQNYPLERPHHDVSYLVDSLNAMYCGGWVFHNWCYANNVRDFFHSDVPQESAFTVENLKKPLTHYLLAGSIRWILQGRPSFDTTPQPIGTIFPNPHSMLINPAVKTLSHWKYASMIFNVVRTSLGLRPVNVQEQHWRIPSGMVKSIAQRYWEDTRALIPDFAVAELDTFKEVYDGLRGSFNDVEGIRNPGSTRSFPTFDDAIDALEDISDKIALRVLNGNTKDRLSYDVRSDMHTNDVTIPDDVYTIAIGGHNLGRGITLSGLCTTVFLTNRGADDTDVQKQRWFGYRGSHLEFVKVFCPDSVWQSNSPLLEEGFKEKNESLMRLYELIAENWNNGIPPDIHNNAWSYGVGLASLVSRKIPVYNQLPSHSHTPIISWVATSKTAISNNVTVVNDLYSEMKSKGMNPVPFLHPTYNNRNLGIMCGTPYNSDTMKLESKHKNGEQFNLLEVANFIDKLYWDGHNPDNTPDPYRIPNQYVPRSLGKNSLYRVADTKRPLGDIIPRTQDPYSIAAYLRLWYHLDKDNQQSPGQWPTIQSAPKFNVIFREGSSQQTWDFPDGKNIRLRTYSRTISDTGQLSGYEWGSMNPVANFGSNKHNDDIRSGWPITDGWRSFRSLQRENGSPGMLQIRFIQDISGNKLPIVSLSIPKGGPILAYHR